MAELHGRARAIELRILRHALNHRATQARWWPRAQHRQAPRVAANSTWHVPQSPDGGLGNGEVQPSSPTNEGSCWSSEGTCEIWYVCVNGAVPSVGASGPGIVEQFSVAAG